MTQWTYSIVIFLMGLFIAGCGGPKRGSVESTGTSTGSASTSGAPGAGTSTGSASTSGAPGVGTSTGFASTSGAPGAGTSTGSASTSGAPGADSASEGTGSEPAVSFAEVKPIFQNHCITCHFNPRIPTAVEVDWADYSATQPYVQNGKLLERVWTLRKDLVKGMPFGNGAGLNGQQMTNEERELVKKWIEGGGLE